MQALKTQTYIFQEEIRNNHKTVLTWFPMK